MHLIACHECDMIHVVPADVEGARLVCTRCGSTLYCTKVDSINRTIAWTVSGLVLYVVAITFPFLGMESSGIERHTALLTGIQEIYNQGMVGLAFLVLITCVLAPLVQMLGLLYVFVPMKLKVRVKYATQVFRTFRHVQPWSMMEVFMLGILVSLVKLGKMATIVPGIAVFAFALLIFALTFAVSSVDSHLVWEKLEEVADG